MSDKKNIISILRVKARDAKGENKNKYLLIDKYRYNGSEKIDQHKEIKNLSENEIVKRIQDGKLSTSYSILKAKISVTDSELLRILKAVHPEGFHRGIENDNYIYWFNSDLITVDVGKSANKYRNVHSYQYIDKKGEPETRISKKGKPYIRYINKNQTKCHTVSPEENGCIFVNGKKYRYLFSTSGDVRGQKARYIAVDIYDKVMEILYCGIDPSSKMLACKRNSYLGMAASTSTPVTMPNIVVVDDYESPVTETYDYVEGNVGKAEYKVKPKTGTEKFKVFDGHGLVNIELAEKWKKDLGLDYVPATFQFRAIPGIKGCVSTFDINQFASKYHKDSITDCWGQEHKFEEEQINCILTKSQWKFADMLTAQQWTENIKPDKYGYKYTFNINDVSVMLYPKQGSNSKALKLHEHISYQPLQVLELSDKQIKNICNKTINKVKRMHTDTDYFLKWRGVNENTIKNDKQIPPEYKALWYNHDLANDSYIHYKILDDLKRTRREAHYLQIVDGSYQFLIPDLFALAQYAFGMKVTGLLPAHTIYNQYWQEKNKQECLLVRNPAIYKETVVANVADENTDNWGKIKHWFKYQESGIVLSIHDSSLQRMQSADQDGDHAAAIFQQDILDSIKMHPSNTVIFKQLDKGQTVKKTPLSDIDSCIESDILGYSNDIGSIVDATTSIINQITPDKNGTEKEKLWEWVRTMSILDCLAIDFAKHGVKAEVPDDIKAFLTEVSKPWFKKYKSDEGTDSHSKKTDAELSKQTTNKKQKYEYTDSTMNQICKYMDEQLKGIEIESKYCNKAQGNKKFDWKMLLNDAPNDYRSQKYVNEKKTLRQLQKQYQALCKDCKYYNKEHKQDTLWRQKTNLFFAEARNKLLQAQPNILKCVDNAIALFYSDNDFKNFKSYAILWNCFPTQMLNQVQGKANREITYSSERLQKIEHRISSKKKKNPKLKTKTPIYIPLTDNDKKVYITSAEQREIKKRTESSRGAKLYVALLWIARKQGNNTIKVVTKTNKDNKYKVITEYNICKLSGVNDQAMQDTKAELCHCGLLAINSGNQTKYQINEIKINGEQKELPVSADKMRGWIKHNFPKSKTNEPYKYYRYNRFTCEYDKIA